MLRGARLEDGGAPEHVVRIPRALPHAENRMDGVITHVAAMKRRILTRVLVEREEVGSRIRGRRNA